MPASRRHLQLDSRRMDDRDTPVRDETPPWAAGTESRHQELYPQLSAEELTTIRSYGEEKAFADGDWLWRAGDRGVDFHAVVEGEMEIIRHDEGGEDVLIAHGPGYYSGETVTLSGKRALVSGRAKGPLRTLSLEHRELRDLLALEAELGEKILLSFILRRMRMIAEHLGDVYLVGDTGEPRAAQLREFLSRGGVPHRVIDPRAQSERGRELIGDAAELPVVICGNRKLVQPSLKTVADCIGLSVDIDTDHVWDLTVIGAGPAGLAAAVYGASEGMEVVVLEKCAIGGQAGSSSRIENYMGFPTGISGQALTGRGYLQAEKFGAQVAIARQAVGLECGDDEHRVRLENGDVLRSRAVIIASGAIYRQPEIENLAQFDMSSVHYGASHLQGMLCRDKDVAIIGGGNSAGQAAVYLARRARKVSVLIRGESLTSSMSHYLIRRIETTRNIDVLPFTEVVSVHGQDGVMDRLKIVDNRTDELSDLPCAQLFIFIGAAAASDFIEGGVLLDDRGFVKTGDQLGPEDLEAAGWPLQRSPYLAETSVPGIFAAGDIRSGSVKRVASAVGEGSVCVQFVHNVVAERRGEA